MLHLVYRYSGKENKKSRPSYYSKELALLSFLRAADELPADEREIVFVNDAPVAPRIEKIMAGAGEMVNRANLNMHQSYWTAMAQAKARHWSDDDLVYFGEDDYLFQPDAFISLVETARKMHCSSYFALYASRDNVEPSGAIVPPKRQAPQRPGEDVMAAGHVWKPALSTTSSFAAYVRDLRRDQWLHKLAPLGGGAWDHVISLVHKGTRPFRWAEVFQPFVRHEHGWVFAFKLAGLRGLLNLSALSRQFRWSQLMAPGIALATHMESAHMALGVEWESVATDTAIWATQKGFALNEVLQALSQSGLV